MEKIRSRLIRHGTRRATLVVAVSQSCMPYSSVRDAIADSPEEARGLKLRSELMDALEAYILREGITQQVAAERLGVPRSRVSELMNGRISTFTIDKLVNMAARVGLNASITIEGVGNTDPAVPNATCSPP